MPMPASKVTAHHCMRLHPHRVESLGDSHMSRNQGHSHIPAHTWRCSCDTRWCLLQNHSGNIIDHKTQCSASDQLNKHILKHGIMQLLQCYIIVGLGRTIYTSTWNLVISCHHRSRMEGLCKTGSKPFDIEVVAWGLVDCIWLCHVRQIISTHTWIIDKQKFTRPLQALLSSSSS